MNNEGSDISKNMGDYLSYDPQELANIKQTIKYLINYCEGQKKGFEICQNRMHTKVYNLLKKSGPQKTSLYSISKTIDLLKKLLEELEEIERIIKKYQTDTPVPTTTPTTTPYYERSAQDHTLPTETKVEETKKPDETSKSTQSDKRI